MTVVLGAGIEGARAALSQAGVTDVVTLDREVLRSEFDDDTDNWVLHTTGEPVRARVVIAAQPQPFAPWTPNIPGRNDFRGESFHAATWDRHFHPVGKRIAVVGTDSWAGHRLGRLIDTAESVIVLAHAPRRVVTEVLPWRTRVTRRLRRRTTPSSRVVGSAIDTITATGIRTRDGVEHHVDAVIYGTGLTTSDQALTGVGGLTLQQAWNDGMEPFLGVAVRGFPNYFFLNGPDTEAQVRYIARCVALMQRTASRRIEVRRSSQQVFNERAQLAPTPPPAVCGAFETFDLSSSAPDCQDTYDGDATLEIDGTRHLVRVRLIGHLDPLDGKYHWQGTIFDALPDNSLKPERAGTLSVGQRTAPVRLVEQTPWGTHSVAGVGAPPYAH